MMIIGVDYHPGFQQIAFFVEETGECGERQLKHSDGEAERFYRDLRQRGIRVRVGLEATGYSRWFERLLAELGFEVWIGDPAEIKTRRVKKQKTDRKDAQLLLRLMREDNFPQIWVPSPENRDLRQLVWHRHRLVQMRTRIMNQLQALAATRIDLSSTLQSPFSCRCLARGKILHCTKRTNVHPRPKNQSDAPSGK